MAGKGAKATAAKSAEKDKGKKAPVSRSSRAGSQEKPAPKKDVYQLFAEKVRDNKQLESRWAIMQETRVEYFRGKDFTTFMRNHPEVREILGPDKDLEVEDIVNTLLSKNLVIRCDRVWKTVRPGKKKLSSWPAHLEIHRFAYFQFTHTNARLWSCTLRAAIFGILWVLLGKRVWFFPNINAEETTFRELVRFWPEKDEGERPKWTSRLFYATVAVLVILLLRHHAPDEAARARYQKKVSNIIDDVLEWSPKLALSGMMEKHTGTNATETSNHTSGTGSSHAPPTNEGNTAKADPDMDSQTNSDEVQDGDEYGDDMRTRFSEV
uniref:Translocation protein SEC62 n=1 Tax=Oryza punctata TaxID=4537 RepID=A0A0E0JZE0_ORYPU